MKEEWHPCMHEISDELCVTKCLVNLRKKDSGRFHSPGHKGRGHFLAEILDIRCDEKNVVEAEKTVNGLKNTLSSRYGAKKCFVGNFGMAQAAVYAVKAVVSYGKIALLRNSPEYIFAALAFLNIEPIIIGADFSDEEIRACVSYADAVIISSPDIIFGEEKNDILFSEAKSSNKKVCVFSDYGGHFVFSEKLPNDYKERCDVAVYALDNVLPCFAGSVATFAYTDDIAEKLSLFPYGIDMQTAMSVEYGVYAYDKYKDAIDELEKNVTLMKKTLVSSDFVLKDSVFTFLIVDTKAMEISGKELEMRLNDMGIYVEYADAEKVVFLFTTEDEKEEITHLTTSLIIAAEQCGQVSEKAYKSVGTLERAAAYTVAFYGNGEYVDLENAKGRIAAQNVWLFGINSPVILAGEKITERAVEYLESPLDFVGMERDRIKVWK